MKVVFSINQETGGGVVGDCLSHHIYTQGDSWDVLRTNVREGVDAYFFHRPEPAYIHLHLVRDEAVAAG